MTALPVKGMDPLDRLQRQLRAAEILPEAIERDSSTRDVIKEAIQSYFRSVSK